MLRQQLSVTHLSGGCVNGMVKWPCCTLNGLMLPRKCNPSSFHESGGGNVIENMTQHSLGPESRYAVIIINMINGFMIPHHWETTEVCVCMQMQGGRGVWTSSELRSGGGESPTAGPEERHQPALVHNTYGMIVRTSSRNAGCSYTHFYCRSICGLRGR